MDGTRNESGVAKHLLFMAKNDNVTTAIQSNDTNSWRYLSCFAILNKDRIL